MKTMIAVMAALVFATPALAQIAQTSEANTVHAFTLALNNATDTCEEMGFKLALDGQTEDLQRHVNAQVDMANGRNPNSDPSTQLDPNALTAKYKPWGDCMAAAKVKGTQIYKDFVASEKNTQLKADARKVIAAWLAYVDTFTISADPGEPDNQEGTALHEAESMMGVDAQ